MTDWEKVAAGIDPAIEVDKIRGVMEGLETTFAPLVKTIPEGENLWTGPEDLA
jgi:hypothetical protein